MTLARTTILSLTAFMGLFFQPPVPVEKEPQHHVKFKNKYVRVLEITFPVGYTTLLHSHSYDNVVIALSNGKLKGQKVGGQPTESNPKPGNASFSKAPFAHQITNTGETILRYVTVELLNSSATINASPSLIPITDKNIIVDNERTRITKLSLSPGETTKVFDKKLPGIFVIVSPAKITINSPGHKLETRKTRQGEYFWHNLTSGDVIKNLDSTNLEAIVIEVK